MAKLIVHSIEYNAFKLDSFVFNQFYANGFFLLFLYNKLGIVQCTYLGVKLKFKKKCFRLFNFTNSADPDEMPLNAAFHLGLHCLQKYPFRGFPNTKG